ncbi:MAG TPA: 30S ribosomal protein S24e [Candidatus Thermoplasmatota archaeon]|nr:30S ribosomal protein S24e [Candidatus Thermoplasmatota archaeon]
MDIEITERKHNPLLARTEVRFQLHHQGEKTPTRDQVREKLAAQMNSKKGLVVVDSMNSAFGRSTTRGYARVYDAQEALASNEPHYLLKRNKLEELKPKKVKKEAPPAAKGGAKKR